MLHGIMAAGLQDVIEADDIGFDVHVRVVDRIPHARLRREVDHDVKLVLGKEVVDQRLVGEVASHERPFAFRVLPCQLFDLGKAVIFERDVVIVVAVVKADDLDRLNGAQEFHHEVRADEARRAGDEDRFVLQIHVFDGHFVIPLYSFLILV